MPGVLLGNFQFQLREVPDIMPWGGRQMLAIHRQIGGTRVIDAMGPDPDPIRWSGLFYGSADVVARRARAVDAIRQSGAEVVLTWGSFTYLVVVKSFNCKYKNEWEQRYTIECEVVSDGPVAIFAPSLDEAIQSDLAILLTIGTT